ALVRRGDNSIVIAAGGSEVRGTLIPSPKAAGRLDEKTRAWGRQVHRELITRALEKFPVDLVHMHSLDFHHYIPEASVPVLATLHLPPDWYPKSIFKSRRPNFYLNCVSSTQQRSCPSCSYLLPHIHNGVDVTLLNRKAKKKKYVLTMGRICPEKGFHFALEAARLAHYRLVLAGQIFPY